MGIDYALELNRREKRLQDWQRYLDQYGIPPGAKQDLDSLFQTYALLITKIAQTENDEQRAETWKQLLDVDRQLSNVFADARLLTRKPRHVDPTPP